ncbi:DUF4468 domain-containing protein [uncultured Hymenobacter sp.]|uniref:DUF4468 domain-containing protein n=1 Tax=uncultured Hymenobacter sp. TaxID=170016 RepID=UPI0035CAC8C1
MRLKFTLNALCYFGLLMCFAQKSQAQNPNSTGAGHYVKKGELDPARLAALPVDADGAIYYEGVIKVDSTISKQDIHQAVREWFVSNYVSGKDVLQVDDKDAGKILGKGIHKYQFVNGINISEVALTFVLSVETKDGKFRYRMYNFTGGNKNTSLLGGANATNTYAVNYNQCLTDYKAGKRTGYNGKIVAGMDYEAQQIISGLATSVKKGKQKSDW